jgi:mono/diheme cytochrome c family protein
VWKQFTSLSALVLVGFPTSLQETKKPAEEKPAAELKIPPEAAKRVNPVKATPGSIAQGKRSYGFDCAMCHGKDGDGKGDLAEPMHLKLRDYRDPAALKDLTDGEIFYIIINGKGQMTGEEGRMKPEQVWDLVNYIRSLAKNESPGKPTAEIPPKIVLAFAAGPPA